MNKIYLIILFYFPLFLYGNEVLLLNEIKSSSVDTKILGSLDSEIYRAISEKLELDIVFSRSQVKPDYLLDVTLESDNSMYYLTIEIIRCEDSTTQLKEDFVKDKLSGFTEDISNFVIQLKEILRDKGEDNYRSQIVVETSIPGADIYINKELIGISPLVIREEIGKTLLVEARTESYKKNLVYIANSPEIEELYIEMEPIVGSMLLTGDILGRNLLLNSHEIVIDSSSLFKDLDIGSYELSMESEWGYWEDTVVIKENLLTEVHVDFSPIARVEIILGKSDEIQIYDTKENPVESVLNDGVYILPPGEYIFESRREGYISTKEPRQLETGYLNRYIASNLKEIKYYPDLASIEEFNRKLHGGKNAALYGSIGAAGLLILGIIGELVTIDLYKNSTISSSATGYREIGEGLRILNIGLLGVGAIGTGAYFGIDLFRKEVPDV